MYKNYLGSLKHADPYVPFPKTDRIKATQESEILISHLGYSDACGQLIAT